MTVTEVLAQLERFGKRYREETLREHCRIGTSPIYDRSEGKRRLAFHTTYLQFANDVRYFFEFTSWPDHLRATHKKVLAPPGPRALLGDPEPFDELVACEGESDWLTLIDRGFPNAITGGGAGNGYGLIAQASKGKRLTILFDRDEQGLKGARALAKKAHALAAEVRIVQLPEMVPGLKDVSDFFNAYGGNAPGLAKLIADSKPYVPPARKQDRDDTEQKVFHHCRKTGRIFDLVVVQGKPGFACFDPATRQITLAERAGKNGCTLPLDTEAVREGHVRFPNAPMAFTDLPALVAEVESFIGKWVFVSPFFRLVSSRYVFLTYIYDRLETVPYLRVLADRGRGKSRYQQVMGALCFRSVNMSGADTASPMFRLIRRYGPTMIIDEGDRRQERNSDTYSSVTKILNYGIHHDGVVWRTEAEGRELVETPFPVFCPKILSSRERFGDTAVESRCITEIMPPCPKDAYQFDITPEFVTQAESLRARLMYWRLTTWHQPMPPVERLSLRVEDRLNQIAAPLVQVMHLLTDDRGLKELSDHIEEMHQEFIDQRRRSDEGVILAKIRSMAAEGSDRAYCKTIAEQSGITRGKEHKPITARAVGAILDRIGLKKVQDRDGWYVPLRDNVLNPVLEAYGVEPLNA